MDTASLTTGLLRNTTAIKKTSITTLTTYARGNHTLRSERYRYLRFEDGTEELYDHHEDPNEWTNLSTLPKHAKLIQRFREELPAKEGEDPFGGKLRPPLDVPTQPGE